MIIARYLLLRNLIFTNISLCVMIYFMFSPNLEGSSVAGKQFISCGINYCRRVSDYVHSAKSWSLNIFLVISCIIPVITSCFTGRIKVIYPMISPIMVSIASIGIYILGNDIVTNTNLMGPDTDRYHGIDRKILWAVTSMPIVLVIVEILIYLFHARGINGQKNIFKEE